MKKRVKKGFTLVELMVAMAVLLIGVVGGMVSFGYINQAMLQARLKTIAANLAQEKMEVLKNGSYFRLRVTTAPAASSGYDPNFVYDTGSYPPETITLWGMPPLTRAVNIDYASVAGASVSTVSYASNDTGMKKITVYVFWTEKGKPKKVQLDSYYGNPSVATLSTGFRGNVVETGTGLPVRGAQVLVIGSPKWRGAASPAGDYSFQVAPGTYSLVCSSAGFFSQITGVTGVSEGLYAQINFSLARIASGTVSSDNVYEAGSGLVISQVVASTPQAGGIDAQYVELFNPTTYPINVGSGALSHAVKLNFTSRYSSQLCSDIPLVYVSTFVPAGRYYLIANTPSFTAAKAAVSADAYYTDTANNSCLVPNIPGYPWTPPLSKPIILHDHSGTVWLTDDSGSIIDAVGWTSGVNVPNYCETACIPLGGGLQVNDQIIRFSTPCSPGTIYGRAHDSGNNSGDFYYNNGGVAAGVIYRPFSSSSPAQTVISGRPSTGAYIFADDGNSAGTQSSLSYLTGAQGQSCLFSSFTLVGVATGTWTVNIMTGSSSVTIAGVTVAQGANTAIRNALTVPAWTPGFNYSALRPALTGGFAAGIVYGAGTDYSVRLPNILMGSPSGSTARTTSAGSYILNLPTGTAVINANYNSDNGNYLTQNAVVSIARGATVYVPDFHLAQGGYIKGYVTSGTGPLPNIPVTAVSGGASYGDTSDDTGYFYIFASTSPYSYTVAPDLDPLESYSSSPNPLTATVTGPGSVVFAGTITVTGAMGTITGNVRDGGYSITSGVLVVASTAPVPDPFPAIYASSAPALSAFYSVSSQADGTYALEVRASSSTYNMRAFYPKVNVGNGAVSYTSKTNSGISVSAGSEVTNKDFTWP